MQTKLQKLCQYLFIPFLGFVSVNSQADQKIVSLKTAVTQNISTAIKANPIKTLARPEVQSFISHMVKKHHFKKEKLRQIFSKVHLRPRIIKTIHNPKEATPWHKYKPIFITDKRIEAGVAFWRKHQSKLIQAEKQFGVPAPIILGVLGVETFYGTRTGKHNAIDALATLAFNYPERSKFFTSELEAFFLLARDQQFDPLELKSSYAGALGYPQFMPSSYRDYGIDFSQDGIADLLNNPDDAIGSVANYLAKKGTWQRHQPIVLRAVLKSTVSLSKKNEKKIKTIAEWAAQGVTLQQPTQQFVDKKTKVTAFKIEEKNATQAYLGFHNFKAILRYNPRINYAMAVVTLADAIQEAKKAEVSAKVRPLVTDSPILANNNVKQGHYHHG